MKMAASQPILAFGALSAALLSVAAGSADMARGQTTEARPIAVSVMAARRRCFQDRVVGSGTIVPKLETAVRAERDGLVVTAVMVDPGDKVEVDQVLARLTAPSGAPRQDAAVKSPVKGTVVSISAPVGSYASPSARDPMFRIVGDTGFELKAEVLASRLGRLKLGQAATVHVPGLGSLAGRVTRIGTALDAITQSGEVAIDVDDQRLRAGAYGRAEIDAGEDCGFEVPLSALFSVPEGTIVGVVRGERVEMRRVDVGLLDGGSAEIREGLAENDQVIARAGAFLREGDRVRPVPASLVLKGGAP